MDPDDEATLTAVMRQKRDEEEALAAVHARRRWATAHEGQIASYCREYGHTWIMLGSNKLKCNRCMIERLDQGFGELRAYVTPQDQVEERERLALREELERQQASDG